MKNRNEKGQLKSVREKIIADYKDACAKILPLYLCAAAVCVVAIICYFFNWVYVYNSDYGIEVKASGFSFLASVLTGNYTGTGGIYGDIAVPFYYYAANACEVLGALTIIAAILGLLALAILIVVRITKIHEVSFVSIILSVASTIVLFCAFIVALGMNDGKILPVYCSGNPKCSICSLAIVPAIVMAVSVVLQVIAIVKFYLARTAYKKGKKKLM